MAIVTTHKQGGKGEEAKLAKQKAPVFYGGFGAERTGFEPAYPFGLAISSRVH